MAGQIIVGCCERIDRDTFRPYIPVKPKILMALPDDFDICQCDKKFRDRIVAKYKQILSQHPLGVPLTEEIHIKFHTFYGFGNNTPEQFLDFVSRFYPEKLEMIREYLKNN